VAAELIAEILDGVALQRGQRDHDKLVGALVLERLEIGGDRHLVGIGQQARVVDHPAGQLGKDRLGASRRQPKRQRHGQHHPAEAPRNRHEAPQLG
jgi:hypothetical protein